MELGKILAIRDKLFKSQKQMALELKTTQQKISLVTTGKQALTLEGISILVNKYKVDANWLLAADDDFEIKYTDGRKIQESTDDAKFKYAELQQKYLYVMEELMEYRPKAKKESMFSK